MAPELEAHHLRGVCAALDYAEAHLETGMVKASEMAWHACMSAFHFERIFLRAVGISPGAYVRTRRLSEAAKLLVHNSDSAASIALGMGYGSAAAFHRAFKTHFQLGPGELRGCGILPYLMVSRARLPGQGLAAMEPPYRPQSRMEQIPLRRLVGLTSRGTDDHSSNMLLDYRLHPQDTHHEMFLGWEVPSLARVPEGLSGLEIPSHPALLVSYRGGIDDQDEALRREWIRTKFAEEHGLPSSPSAWKLTRSSACPEGAGYRIWEIEIPLP